MQSAGPESLGPISDAAVQRAIARPGSVAPAAILSVQRAAGNQATMRMLAQRQAGSPAQIQRFGRGKKSTAPQVLDQAPGAIPATPAIGVAASPGNEGFGGHATVFLQLGPEHGAKRIDLTLVDEKIVIRILDADTWADPSLGATKTWQITADAADRALFLAQRFQSNQGDYTYSKLGVGFRRYNCALFAEKILQAAGVAASSGAIASSPGQLVTGKRGPSAELKKPKTPGFDRPGSEASRPKGPPPPLAVPAQYDL